MDIPNFNVSCSLFIWCCDVKVLTLRCKLKWIFNFFPECTQKAQMLRKGTCEGCEVGFNVKIVWYLSGDDFIPFSGCIMFVVCGEHKQFHYDFVLFILFETIASYKKERAAK